MPPAHKVSSCVVGPTVASRAHVQDRKPTGSNKKEHHSRKCYKEPWWLRRHGKTAGRRRLSEGGWISFGKRRQDSFNLLANAPTNLVEPPPPLLLDTTG